jgi:anti-repressor protein
MNEATQTSLIPLWNATIGQETLTTVNARELHAFLESQTKFADWIKRRISDYAFVQDVDFTVFLNSEKNSDGRPAKDYFLTLDMAKELAMVERNQKGKEARQYFIACERAYKDQLHQIEQEEIALRRRKWGSRRLPHLEIKHLHLSAARSGRLVWRSGSAAGTV